MRILTVTNYYPPYYIGGYEIACKETMDYLKSKGHEIAVLTSNYDSIVDKDDHIERTMHLTDYSKASKFKKLLDEHHNYKIVKNAIKSFKPDLVYFWSLRGIGLAVIEAADELKIAKAFEIGDFWMQGYMHKASKFKQNIKSLLPMVHTATPHISPAICVSDWVAKEMHDYYQANNTYVLPNATQIPNEPKHETEQIVRFLFAGRLEEEKGLDQAIEALIMFHEKYPYIQFTFDIYGEGDLKYLDHCLLLSEPIKEMIHFKGKAETKEEIYDDGGILLMPTRMREPFGLVIIEAMARGCAVIATNAYGPSEIIEHEKTGLLFEPENRLDLMRQMEKLVFNIAFLKKIQENGYTHVKTNYAITTVKSKVEALLKEIAGVA